MKQHPLIWLIALLAVAALACSLPGLPSADEVAVPVEAAATAAAAAEQAGRAAATAAAVAGQQSETLLATVEASNFDINMNLEALADKFANIQPDENGNVTVTLTDDEINQALQGQPSVSQDGVTLEALSVLFTGGNVVLMGNLTEPLAAQFNASFRPEVEDGQLRFTLVGATLGRLPVPPALLQSVENTLNNTIGGLVNNIPATYRLQSVSVEEGSFTVVAAPTQ